MKQYTLKEAEQMLGVTYRTILYYRDVYTSDVTQDGRNYYVTDAFIEKVKNNKRIAGNKITDPRTKEQLISIIEDLETEVQLLTKYKTDFELLETEVQLLTKYKTDFELLETEVQLLNKYKTDFELRDEETEEGLRVEYFTDEEYALFETRLREWYSLRKEVELKDTHFIEMKASKDEIIEHYKGQFEYQRQLSDRQLQQMDKLLDHLKDRNLREAERSQIEAVEKKVIGRFDDPYNSRTR